ncbi:hypothetical protein [Streptomyces sp. NPDC050804]|uniref:hypothetical protein n=1 Tax=Streptomyces sp. NPDC050804 TaxID=3154745 RepID=UPI0034391524
MTEPTPYDDNRAAYSRQGLARLVLSDHARDVAESAAGLVGTRHDADTGLAGRASQARQLVEQADQALTSAVIYEVERGSSWNQIAAYLGISADEAEERYSPALQAWNSAFEEPYRLDETGRKRIPQLPTAAYDPDWACAQLDQWAFLQRIGINDQRAVSTGLVMAGAVDEPHPTADRGPEIAHTGLSPERAERVSALTAELRPTLAEGIDMPAIQELLSACGIGVMDSILITRQLLGAGPEALAQAKTLVLTSPARHTEHEHHQALVENLVAALDQTDTEAEPESHGDR